MRGIRTIFSPSSDKRNSSSASTKDRATMPKPRLERRNAMKDIDYDFVDGAASADLCSSSPSSSCSSSSEAIRARSLDLYDGKTSFRIDGAGEFKLLCETLGFSGIEDFAISPEEYSSARLKSKSVPVSVLDRVVESAIGRESDGNCVNDVRRDVLGVGLEDKCGELIGDKFGGVEMSRFAGINDVNSSDNGNDSVDNVGARANQVINADVGVDVTRFVDAVRVSEVFSCNNGSDRSNLFCGNGKNGIKGVRPPVLVPPPMMSLPIIDKECSTWDMLRGFGPESDSTMRASRFRQEFCDEDLEGKEGDGTRRVLTMDENCVLSGSCSFTTTASVDDDCSTSTTTPVSSVSPTVGFKRVIVEWQKGDLLGRGSFGSVYEGIADDGSFFAVKEVSLLDQGEEAKQSILQLEQEIALLSQFEHKNIVQYYGTQKDESHFYIFLELVKLSLLSLYQKYTLKDSQVSAYTGQILHGLKYLHDKNVIHRDIKCANILVATDGLVKLADFGLAKATKLNDVKSCKGTAFWMAPEVVRSRGYGIPADIWSLGCTVLEMLTGRFPFSNMEPMAAVFKIGRGERPHIPESLTTDARDFILQCLQVDPSMRPTASQLLDHPFVNRPLPSFSSFPSPHHLSRQP